MEVRVGKVSSTKELLDAVMAGYIAVWDSNKPLYEALQEIYDRLSNRHKYSIRVCKNIKYRKPVALFSSGQKQGEFTEFFRLVEFFFSNQEKMENPYIVVSSNIQQELFDTIQQMIYLKLKIDIYTEEELERKRLVDAFRSKYKRLKDIIEKTKDRVSVIEARYKDSDELKERITGYFDDIGKVLSRAEEDIKVAVFATKKTGKSMVVNGLIGEDFAPTSLELPTPNNIVYIPAEENIIKLEYKNEETYFNSPYECKVYIKQEFEKVKKEGAKIEDMQIYYPYKNYKQKKYRIYDTPGPDLASSKNSEESHKEVYKKALLDSDVAVFVIDYSKYAQESEVKLFQEIKEQFFDKSSRNMSFICAVNKIDLVFNDAESEKMVIKIADFISEKFKSLGFQNFIVIPLSAMTYFYLEKLSSSFPDIKEANNIRSKLIEIEGEISEDDESLRTYLTFIQNISNSIANLYGIRNLRYEDILNLSYFDYFESYIDYIVSSKAKVERIFSIISFIESTLTAIKNEIEGRIRLLEGDLEKIREILSDFLHTVKEDKNSPISKENLIKSLTETKIEIHQAFIDAVRRSLKDSRRQAIQRVKFERESIEEDVTEDILAFKNGYLSESSFRNKYSSLEVVIKPEIETSNIEITAIAIDEKLKTISKQLKERANLIEEKVKELNHSLKDILGKEISYDSFEIFSVPEFSMEISSHVIIEELKKVFDGLIFEHEHKFSNLFVKRTYEEGWIKVKKRTETYVNESSIRQQIAEMEQCLKDKIYENYDIIEEFVDSLLQNFKADLDKHFSIFEENITRYIDAVSSSVVTIQEDIEKDIVIREDILKVAKSINEAQKELFNIWEVIKNAG